MPNSNSIQVGNMSALTTASNYQFSAVNLDDLGAAEYTLVTIAVDVSSSVSGFKDKLEKCLYTIVDACQKAPRSENIMVRLVSFNSVLSEIHGFKPLGDIDVNDYKGVLFPSGMTALCDAVQSSVEATQNYGKTLVDQDYDVNGIIYVLTDGQENASAATERTVRTAIEVEALDDLTVVLVGLTDEGGSNQSRQLQQQYLDGFKTECNINQYVDIGDANASNLAKLGKMISKSISSTSTSLAQGQNASQSASSLLSF